jgi:hypothetical protein
LLITISVRLGTDVFECGSTNLAAKLLVVPRELRRGKKCFHVQPLDCCAQLFIAARRDTDPSNDWEKDSLMKN